MTHELKILHIEDVQSDAELVDRILKKSGIAFTRLLVDTREEYLKALDEFQPDVILSDHSLPAFNSLEALNILKKAGRDVPFILITATVSEEFAVNVMKEGASDYVLKDRLQRLPSAVINAIEKQTSEAERQSYLNRIVASEALFQKAESLAEFGTWKIDLVNNITTWSAGTFKLFGYKQGEVEPSFESFLKVVHPEDVQTVKDTFRHAVEQGEPYENECRIIHSDGTIRYLRRQFEFEKDESGKPVLVIGFTQDITRSKHAQLMIEQHVEELKEASERQSGILNALPPNIVLLNGAGKIVAVNESWRNFTLANNLGVPRHGVGYSYLAISDKATGMDEVSARRIARGIKEVIAGEKTEFSTEYSYYSGDKKVWFQLLAAPLLKSGKGAVVLHIDITDRKQAEELLIQSKANLQTIFENTDVAYVLCDTEHRVISFNSKANELCVGQFNKKLKTGSNAFNYFPKNLIPNLKELFEKVMNNEMVSYENSYELQNGGVKWYEVRWAGVADARQVNIGFIVAFKDITERKISELERERMTNDLVQRNRDLEQFTYIVSHNLRAPVANIMGLSNMLNNFDFNLEEHQEVKTALATSISALDNMIMDLNQILQVSTHVNERFETIPFKFLMEDVLLNLRQVIDAEHAKVSYNFNTVDRVVAVKSYMYSIFYNLISNGIKYKKAGVDPVISVFTRRHGDRVQIIFRDNGKGIEEKNLKNLFGLYRRFDTHVEGKGMGLFMVKMQVETMDGHVTVESEPGKGATFILDFPDLKIAD
ncbi:MAG: PAS domain S-box protein [Bacteroidetes bacterium]|nr:PAS domain S-box protein [Bacteroidota bacterium]